MYRVGCLLRSVLDAAGAAGLADIGPAVPVVWAGAAAGDCADAEPCISESASNDVTKKDAASFNLRALLIELGKPVVTVSIGPHAAWRHAELISESLNKCGSLMDSQNISN